MFPPMSVHIRLGLLLVRTASILLAVPDVANAFSYNEHCRVSNHALSLAIRSARPLFAKLAKENARPIQARLEVIESLTPLTVQTCNRASHSQSFGDLVALVDAANSPADFFVGYWNADAFTQLDGNVIPWAVIHKLGDRKLNWFRAMHQNEEHFADRALLAYGLWHKLAIAHAASGRANTALLIEAFAQHYLQDVHAPGHVRTPRRRLNDDLAYGMHNFYNRRGAPFSPILPNAERVFAPFEAEIARLPELAPIQAVACGLGSGMMHCLKAWTNRTIRFKGDGLLRDEPVEELYLTLVAASSVLDLIRAALTASPEAGASISGITYSPARTLDGEGRNFGRWVHARASIGTGQFLPDTARFLPQMDGILTPILAVQFFPSAENAGGADERLRIGVDVVAFGRPGEWRVSGDELKPRRSMQLAMALGADFVNDPGGPYHGSTFMHAAGPFARATVPLPAINMQFSGLIGVRRYRYAGEWGSHGAIRIETGFGFLWVGLETGVDSYVATSTGQLKRGWAFSPSIAANLPRTLRRFWCLS